MSDNGEMAAYQEAPPLTAVDIRQQVNTIQEVMKAVMQQGQHYGKVPGCGDKPTLLKPGAEKIMATFRIAAEPEVVDMSFNDIIRFRVMCRMVSPSGRTIGVGVGECSSEEEKYKWRAAVCDAEYDATAETHKRLKFNRDGKQIKQVRTNPYDLANTILKMAKKRALVDGTLTATAASDIFTQDIEDMPEELRGNGSTQKPPMQPPQPKSAQSPTGADQTVEGYILDISQKSGEKNGKPWTLYGIFDGGNWYNTFDKKLHEAALIAQESGAKVNFSFRQGAKSKDLVSLEIIPEEETIQEPFD